MGTTTTADPFAGVPDAPLSAQRWQMPAQQPQSSPPAKQAAPAAAPPPPENDPFAEAPDAPASAYKWQMSPEGQKPGAPEARTGMLANFEAGAYGLVNNLFGGLKTPQIIPEEKAPLNPGGPVAANNALDYAARGAGAGLAAAPAAMIGAGGPLAGIARIGSSAVSGAGSGAGAYAGQKLAPPGYEKLGSEVGSVAGGMVAPIAANKAFGSLAPTLDPETAALAKSGMDKNIPVSAADLDGGWVVRNLYNLTGKLPFSGAGKFEGTQQEAVNRAIADTFGEEGPRANKITPELLMQARQRIGDVFDRVAQRSQITFDPQLGQDLSNIVTSAPQVITPQEMSPILRQMQNIIGKVQPGGTISGEAYQGLTRKGTPLDLAIQSANPNISQFASQIRNSLDDALERSAKPEDLAALKQARTQWKALRTIEPLTMRADVVGGPTASTGDINPNLLLGAVAKSYKNAPTAQVGDIPLKDIAQFAQRFLKEPKTSGTAERANLSHMLHGGAGLAGAAGLGLAGHEAAGLPLLPSALIGGGSLALNRLIQSTLRNQEISRGIVANSQTPPTLADILLRTAGPRLAGVQAVQQAQPAQP